MAFRKRKNKTDLPPPPGGLPLPPPPGDLPLPPAPSAELPPSKSSDSPPTPSVDVADIPSPPEPPTSPIDGASDDEVPVFVDDIVEVVSDDDEVDDNYADLWQNRTEKSLQQMYGHIDRLGSGEVGTLLERYADRFGHELDREIIVMRKTEREGLREAAPVVELISTPDGDSEDDEESDSDEFDELRIELSELEDEMRPLKKQFDAAKSKGKKAQVQKIGKQLRPMATRRKLMIAILAGDEDISALDNDEALPVSAISDEDQFPAFFEVVNNLLGDMPDEFVNNFIASKNFPLFEKVGDDPAGTNKKTRKQFFQMVNNELGDMPDEQLQSFMESPDFQLFIAMSEIYGA